MKPIVTVTLNPSVDGAAEAEVIHPIHKIRTSAERYDPGGGGINVARVVRELGGTTSAIYLAGGATGGRVGRSPRLCGRWHRPAAGCSTRSPPQSAFAGNASPMKVRPEPSLKRWRMKQRCATRARSATRWPYPNWRAGCPISNRWAFGARYSETLSQERPHPSLLRASTSGSPKALPP